MRRKLGGVNDRDYLAKCVVFIRSLEPEAEWPAVGRKYLRFKLEILQFGR